MATTADNTGSNAVWAIVVLLLVAVIVWLLVAGPLSGGRGGGGDGTTDINVDVEMPSAPTGGGQ
jgi:hypothetical protein